MRESKAGSICLGVIGAPHGLRGDLRVRCFTEEPEDVGAYGPVHDETGAEWRLRIKERRKEGVVAHLDGIEDRDAAAALNGRQLFVARDALPRTEEDTYYHADLLGLEVVDSDGRRIGTIHAIYDFGAGDILEFATPEGRLEMVPFTHESVPVVDLEGGRVVVERTPEEAT